MSVILKGGNSSNLADVDSQLNMRSGIYPGDAMLFKTAQATASGTTAVWTPTSGKKFRLLAYRLAVTDQATAAGGVEVTFKLQDAAVDIALSHDVFLPNAAIAAPIGVAYDSGWTWLGNGYLSSAANNVLNVNLSAALTAGHARIIAAGYEQ